MSWIKDLLGDEAALKAKALGISTEVYLNMEGEKVPAGSDGLMTILNWLAHPDTPYKKGLMIGFDQRHTGAHIYRSILEGIALTMKTNADLMCIELDLNLENVIVSGGGSNSDLFMQIFADIFGLPASRTVVNGAASLGSAICAAVAVGVHKSYDEAMNKMVRTRDSFLPNQKNHALYTRMNEEVYKNITRYTDEVLKKTYPIFG